MSFSTEKKMNFLLLFASLLGLTSSTYPPFTTQGTYQPFTTGGFQTYPFSLGGAQNIGFENSPFTTGGIQNYGLQTYLPSTYNTFGSGYFPSSSYLSNIYPTVVSHYLYFPGGNPWEPGRNFIDLRVNPYPWYLRYYGGLGSGFGSTTFPGGFGTFGSSLGFPSGLDGSLTTGYQTNGFPFGSSFGIDPSFSTLTGSLGYGNIGFQGLGGYIPTGNLGGNIHYSKFSVM